MADDVSKQVEDENEAIMEAMLDGSFNPEGDSVDKAEEEIEEEEVTEEEDTDQEDETEEDEELDEAGDGELNEDSEEEVEDEEENTLVDEDSSEEDVEEEVEVEEEEVDETKTEETTETTEDTTDAEDDTETEDEADVAETGNTDEIDYKKFYEEVAMGDITVNGNKVKKFTDPKKIIQSIQMAGGFSEKMAGFKKYRKFTSAIKDRGMLEDTAKFDLAMNIMDGDPEAIKQHLKNLKINPIDIEMEEINYSGKTAVSSQEKIALDDTMDLARASGVEERMRRVIGSEWDEGSFNEFVSNPAIRSDLLDHMRTGAYDQVQSRIQEIKLTDVHGAFASKNSVGQYREAVAQLVAEQAVKQEQVDTSAQAAEQVASKARESTSKVKAAKAKIAEKRRKADYANKVKAEEKKVADKRLKAAAVSKKKPKAKAKKAFDPMDVEGEDLDQLMDMLISGGRG